MDKDSFTTVFQTELEKAGFSVIARNDRLFDEPDRVAADYLIGATIVEASAKLCAAWASFGDFDQIKGDIELAMEWQIYSRQQRRVVVAIVSRGGIEQAHFTKGGAGGLFNEVFKTHIHQFANSPQFRNLIVVGKEGD
ncbi:hypothetical protein PsB1_0308 [Candidatus Phycosocius spiralis]|uniref:Uncharacterized protein n=2 Tax=Candidatus Phycosocius spiralis TaxID=2815099 RepID=A0ABQ4PT28_9PROT|nr:hypothetical protein PsB1_0308 [Candidatus Phycosocius spiralis]